MYKIGFLEDDEVVRANYVDLLGSEGYQVVVASRASGAAKLFLAEKPDLVLLDISLPDDSLGGIKVCKELREQNSQLPVIFFTSHTELDRQSQSWRAGADDYVTKDTNVELVLLRIKALLKRYEAIRGSAVTLMSEIDRGLQIDRDMLRASWRGHTLELSLTQFWILDALVSNMGRPISQQKLQEAANIVVEPSTIAAHIKAITDTLKEIDSNFDAIKIEHGESYRWAEPEFPRIPGYTVIQRLVTGGMATIYLAEQNNFQRRVALKVMAPHLLTDSAFGDRFLREARIVAKLNHPNFVPVYDVGRSGDFHYLAMEYLPGGDLKEKMLKGVSPAEAIRIVKEIAAALHFAHGHNFVHRDIKPQNILLRADGTAVVCDFGIAKSIDSQTQLTRVGSVMGTPNFMSPEQAQSLEVDGRSDLYSLGVIFYEMLVGQVPYRGDTAMSTAIMHISSPIPRLPADLVAFQSFVDKAIAKVPENRFQSGIEMIHALEELEDEHHAALNSDFDSNRNNLKEKVKLRANQQHRTQFDHGHTVLSSATEQSVEAIRKVAPLSNDVANPGGATSMSLGFKLAGLILTLLASVTLLYWLL